MNARLSAPALATLVRASAALLDADAVAQVAREHRDALDLARLVGRQYVARVTPTGRRVLADALDALTALRKDTHR